jgi:hypothetical protein
MEMRDGTQPYKIELIFYKATHVKYITQYYTDSLPDYHAISAYFPYKIGMLRYRYDGQIYLPLWN